MFSLRRLACLVLFAALLATPVFAQTLARTDRPLMGSVTDLSGAVMQAVTVRAFAQDNDRPAIETVTDAEGRFALALPTGLYRVLVAAPGFTPFEQVVTVPRREPLEVTLRLGPLAMVVEVTPDRALAADTAMSLTSIMMSGDDLLDLPRDRDEMARYLMLLAGADISGDTEQDVAAHFVIDGFSGGRLPRADRIAQVVVDPNPMSADGRGGPRIEIITRPGTGEWRRSADLTFADTALNARTPGDSRKVPRQTRGVALEMEGPAISNLLDIRLQMSTETDERAGESLRAITPSGNLFQGVVAPRSSHGIELGGQLTLSPMHHLDVLWTHGVNRSANVGVGGFTLPERGLDERNSDWMFEAREQMFRQDLTNNIRLQVSQSTNRVTPIRNSAAINVADAFNGGGATGRRSDDDLRVRIDDKLKWQRGPWGFEWGGWLEHRSSRSIDQDNFNGTFEFASLHDYCRATDFVGANCEDTRQIVDSALAQGMPPVYLDARRELAEIVGLPETFSQSAGNARLDFQELAFDTHVQADRRLGRQASLRLGLRYDGTNHSREWFRLDPTVNFQYRVSTNTVVSLGSQLVFDDFRDTERLLRNDGLAHLTELVVSSPSFPDPLEGSIVVNEDTASLWKLDPSFRSPYRFNPQFSLTQQVRGGLRLTLSYAASYGRDQRRTRNINAPYPGTPLPPELLELPPSQRQRIVDEMRPLYPFVGNVTQIESTGRASSKTLGLRVQPRGTVEVGGVALSGSLDYTYRSAYDDNDFNNPYARAWGPARRDHTVQSRFRMALPDEVTFRNPLLRTFGRATYEGMTLNFTLLANTGRLYSIRSGRDLNGDQSGNDRPVGVSRNSAVGPANWNLDMTLSKDYRLGRRATSTGSDTGTDRAQGPLRTLSLNLRAGALFLADWCSRTTPARRNRKRSRRRHLQFERGPKGPSRSRSHTFTLTHAYVGIGSEGKGEGTYETSEDRCCRAGGPRAAGIGADWKRTGGRTPAKSCSHRPLRVLHTDTQRRGQSAV